MSNTTIKDHDLDESPYIIHYEPIMECVGFEEIPMLPEYIFDRRKDVWDDCFGRPFCYILKVADANKYGLHPSKTITNKDGEFGIYEAPMLINLGMMEKIESGELLAYYAYNDVHPELTYSGHDCPLLVMKNKDGEDVFVAVNEEIDSLIESSWEDDNTQWYDIKLAI